MRTAKIIFIAACAFLCIWPLIRISSFNAIYQRDGSEAAFVQSVKAPFFDTIMVSGPAIEEVRHLGFFNEIWTSAGVHLIHDPSLGREVKISGPQSALDHLRTGGSINGYSFRFDRPMLMDEPVEVRLNLNAHHPGVIDLGFDEHHGTGNLPRFTTLGPIEAEVVRMRGCAQTDTPIELRTAWFFQDGNCPDTEYAGDIGRIDARLSNDPRDYTAVAVETIDLEPEWPNGRTASFRADSVHLWYGFDRQNEVNVPKLLDGAPDTIYLPANAIMTVEWRHDEELPGLDTALVVRRDL